MTKLKTTLEMDGLYTQEDINNRPFIMVPCIDCKKWNKHDTRQKEHKPCGHCGSENYDVQSSHWMSIRTWKPGKKFSATKTKNRA